MFMRSMLHRLSFLTGLLLMALLSNAQNNFLYIQSENNQPYHIQLKGNIHSSNAKGYLLIPNLPNGDYSMVLGFPSGAYREYNFKFSINNKPKGYALKITQEGEWMLMDMVSLALVRGEAPEQPISVQPGEKQIEKVSERVTEAGIEQVYKVRNGGKAENLVIFIPVPKLVTAREAQKKMNQ